MYIYIYILCTQYYTYTVPERVGRERERGSEREREGGEQRSAGVPGRRGRTGIRRSSIRPSTCQTGSIPSETEDMSRLVITTIRNDSEDKY